MCPLLWCRDNFNDLPSCLHHLLTCPWLTDSWYWCPLCHRPERFRAIEATPNDSVNNPVLGKASRLKRAVSFFKHFGRKSSTRVNISVTFFQSGDRSHCCLPELQTSDSIPMARNFQDLNDQRWRHDNEWTAQDPCEKGIDPDDYRDEPKTKSYSGQHAKVGIANPIHDPVQIRGTLVAELPAYSQPRGPGSLEISASNIAYLEPIDVIYENKSTISPLPQPSSPNNVSTICSDSDSLMPQRSSIFPVQQTVYNPLSSITDRDSRPAVYVQECVRNSPGIDHHQKLLSPKGDISGLLPPFSYSGKSTNERSLTATEASVEELGGLVCALHGAWMQTLTTNIGEPVMKAKISQCSPFEEGIRVLRQYWDHGDLPNVFEDAFALMNIAYACAWMFHRDDTLGFWNTFFQDVLKWHHVLLTHEDKHLFLKAAYLIWSPPGPLSVEAMYPNLSQPNTLIELEGNTPIEAPLFSRELLSRESYTPPSQSFVGLTGLDFENGEVIQVCARYLDRKFLRNIIACSPWLRLSVYRLRALDN